MNYSMYYNFNIYYCLNFVMQSYEFSLKKEKLVIKNVLIADDRYLSGLLRRLAMTACPDSYCRLSRFVWIASRARNDGMLGFVWQVIAIYLDSASQARG